jgi:hypothetical protein
VVKMDLGEYIILVRQGNTNEIISALTEHIDIKVNKKQLDHKLKYGIDFVPSKNRERQQSRKLFNVRFFAKLLYFPSVSLEVHSSKTELKKTCYGFRDALSGERVYLRYDIDSILEFRDSPAGHLTGKRYYINGLHKMRQFDWHKAIRLIDRNLKKMRVVITKKDLDEYVKINRERYVLSYKLRERRKKYLDRKERKCQLKHQQANTRQESVQPPQPTQNTSRIIHLNQSILMNSSKTKVYSSSILMQYRARTSKT